MLANMQLPSRVMLCTCTPAASRRLENVVVVDEQMSTLKACIHESTHNRFHVIWETF